MSHPLSLSMTVYVKVLALTGAALGSAALLLAPSAAPAPPDADPANARPDTVITQPEASMPVGGDGSQLVRYQPPVAAPVTDSFRPPATFAGVGNRGLEYATRAGQGVVASAEGVVVFAGSIAGDNFVTIQHADGLRTSYSYLASFAVAEGQAIGSGDTIGIADSGFHFGVRVGDTYLDPAVLLGASSVERERARLIPVNS